MNDNLLNRRIDKLDFDPEFCLVCELAGFQTLQELLCIHSSDLLKLPGFNYHRLNELTRFLEKNDLGNLLDAE